MDQHGTNKLALLYTTCEPDQAQDLARKTLDTGLCACVNAISGMQSFYRWKGELQFGAETILIVKTTEESKEACKKAILAMHPYETPCLFEIAVSDCSSSFLTWVQEQVTSKK